MRQLKIAKSITPRDSVSLDIYLADIAKKEMITVEEEGELARLIKTGDHKALVKLTTANLRFVVSVAKQFQNQGLSLEDLINEGNIGLIKAAGRFDETRGFKFISYAVWWIRQGIMQAVAEQSRIVRLPLNKVGVVTKVKKMQAVLEQSLERVPTSHELAEALELPEKEITNTMASSVRHISTDATIAGGDLVVGDTLASENTQQPDALLIRDSRSIEIGRALATLSQRESDVVTMFYGINKKRPYTLEEIGMEYGLTRERVRQIKEKAIRALRPEKRSKHLKTYLG